MSMSMSLFVLNANVLRLGDRRQKWDFNLDLKVYIYTADRCRAELSRQWVPHSRGSHAKTPCSQLRPRSRNEQKSRRVEQNEDWTGQCCQTREHRRAWNTSAPCSEQSQKPAKRPWTEFSWRPATSEAHRVELVWCVQTSQCGQQNVYSWQNRNAGDFIVTRRVSGRWLQLLEEEGVREYPARCGTGDLVSLIELSDLKTHWTAKYPLWSSRLVRSPLRFRSATFCSTLRSATLCSTFFLRPARRSPPARVFGPLRSAKVTCSDWPWGEPVCQPVSIDDCTLRSFRTAPRRIQTSLCRRRPEVAAGIDDVRLDSCCYCWRSSYDDGNAALTFYATRWRVTTLR